jgi:hypothetical protein
MHLLRNVKTMSLALLIAGNAGAEVDSRLRLSQTIALVGDTFHVQGIEIDGNRLWVTSVDTKGKKGLLTEYTLPTGKAVRSVEIQDGIRFHPGGLTADKDSLWIPVAEYARESTAVIQRRNKRTLKLEAQFSVNDHIGAVAVTPEGVAGANWDAREFYIWDRGGKLLRKLKNPSEVAIQDMKFVSGRLVGGGLASDKSGVLVWMDWPSLRVVQRLPVGRTDRGVAYTHEGMTIRRGKLWLLPEDGASRLFAFDVPAF